MADDHTFAILSVLTVVLLVGIGGLFLSTNNSQVIYREVPLITGQATSGTQSIVFDVEDTVYILLVDPIKTGQLTPNQNTVVTFAQDGTCFGDVEVCTATFTPTTDGFTNAGNVNINVRVSQVSGNEATDALGASATVSVINVANGGGTGLVPSYTTVGASPATVNLVSTLPPGGTATVRFRWTATVSQLTPGASTNEFLYEVY